VFSTSLAASFFRNVDIFELSSVEEGLFVLLLKSQNSFYQYLLTVELVSAIFKHAM